MFDVRCSMFSVKSNRARPRPRPRISDFVHLLVFGVRCTFASGAATFTVLRVRRPFNIRYFSHTERGCVGAKGHQPQQPRTLRRAPAGPRPRKLFRYSMYFASIWEPEPPDFALASWSVPTRRDDTALGTLLQARFVSKMLFEAALPGLSIRNPQSAIRISQPTLMVIVRITNK